METWFFISCSLFLPFCYLFVTSIWATSYKRKHQVFNSQKLYVTITSVIFNCMYFHGGFRLSDSAVTTRYIIGVFVVNFG